MGLNDWFNTLHMDYDGQARAEKLSRIIILLFGFVGFIWGYIIQQFSETVRILGAGFILAAILTIPPWPIYRRKPLSWQKVRPQRSGDSDGEGKTKKKKQ
ncbi:Signal peptidase complex subunit 1 [Orchesella cincta]|uniref:Signal peptidase complex subunit 1 n=1 Tax=Orchesella cincta TaxID=48709 RepID=A0A1D2MQ40_ORCCI|nr:Signal peptidase complex subunit 1 [Orchesella cincta]